PCYLPSDVRREFDSEEPSRESYDLPQNARVLCAFSNTYKILPDVFSCWMRLLRGHPDAVLWLRHAGDDANQRLRSEASRRGIDGRRLIFARAEPIPRYLSRFRLADLFLDSAPFGAHTTVNDALWAGLPVLTVSGTSFAGRASASQVLASGTPELVADDLAQYEAIAERMLREPSTLRAIAGRLRAERDAKPLFDIARYARAFGDAVFAAFENVDDSQRHSAIASQTSNGASSASVSVDTRIAFVAGGTQKGGTTALATYLIEHPEISLATVKESHFFDTEENFAQAKPDYAGYHALYAPRPGASLLGDCTPIYMYWSEAPRRIAAYNPAMKWILFLRNPVTRAYSQWNMEVKRGRETLPFEEAVRAERARCAATGPLQHRRWSYVDRGRYSVQLRRIAQYFPRSQMLVLKSEAFRIEPAPALARIAAFLGVGPFPRSTKRDVFALPYDAPITESARQFVYGELAEDIREVERMLGWDCSDWRP
ncbi:MAG: sulfotransferase domain-containing protein, partial [Burkholderiales bacterium]